MSNRPSDVIYMSMPLYHSAALALGMGMALGFGSKTIIRKKFSARNFFKDCALYKVTVSLPLGCLEENTESTFYQLTSWIIKEKLRPRYVCITPKINSSYCINTSCLPLMPLLTCSPPSTSGRCAATC